VFALTGFVQIDAGIHVITAFAGKENPADITPNDLDNVADYLERIYSDGVGQSLAAGIAFTNSGFAQASWNDSRFRYKRKAYANLVLRGHQHHDLGPILQDLEKEEYRAMVLREKPHTPRCAFTGQPAYLRISRDMLPMLNGRGVMNFSSLGIAGLPVSDVALLAIHAMPLGCVISQGRLLAIESDDVELAFEFVKLNLENNRRNLSAAQGAGWKKLPNQSAFKTTLIEGLMRISRLSRGRARFKDRFPSLTAYHFSNSGTDPKIDIYALPSSVVDFVITVSEGQHQAAWEKIVAMAWQEEKSEEKEKEDAEPKLTRRNHLYEDLFGLPDNARRFIRMYILRQPLGKIKKDIRSTYDWRREADLISWDLTDLFLRRMMNVEQAKINNIRLLGDRLAEFVMHNDRRLISDLYNARKYHEFRSALLRAFKKYRGDADKPLIEFDGFVSIFEEGEDFARLDWRLSCDLLLIRLFEQLHRAGMLNQIADEIAEPQQDNEVSTQPS
jgi:CRISPR-associated protein Cst1